MHFGITPTILSLNTPVNYRDLPISQTGLKQVNSSPEGKLYAPLNLLVTDTRGNLYIKTTGEEVSTGWGLVQVV